MSFIPESTEACRAFLEAVDIATKSGHSVSTSHVLLALFTFPNSAEVLLRERNLNEDGILREIRVVEAEEPQTVSRLRERARELAAGTGSPEVDCLHVLIALLRLRDCFAYRLLERSGVAVTALRNIAVSYVTGCMPRRYRSYGKPGPAAAPLNPPQGTPRRVSSPTAGRESLGGGGSAPHRTFGTFIAATDDGHHDGLRRRDNGRRSPPRRDRAFEYAARHLVVSHDARQARRGAAPSRGLATTEKDAGRREARARDAVPD